MDQLGRLRIRGVVARDQGPRPAEALVAAPDDDGQFPLRRGPLQPAPAALPFGAEHERIAPGQRVGVQVGGLVVDEPLERRTLGVQRADLGIEPLAGEILLTGQPLLVRFPAGQQWPDREHRLHREHPDQQPPARSAGPDRGRCSDDRRQSEPADRKVGRRRQVGQDGEREQRQTERGVAERWGPMVCACGARHRLNRRSGRSSR